MVVSRNKIVTNFLNIYYLSKIICYYIVENGIRQRVVKCLSCFSTRCNKSSGKCTRCLRTHNECWKQVNDTYLSRRITQLYTVYICMCIHWYTECNRVGINQMYIVNGPLRYQSICDVFGESVFCPSRGEGAP